MKKKTILILILVASMSLSGILLTQIYWVNTSFELKEEQFNNSVRIALKSVINLLVEQKTDTLYKEKLLALSCRKPKLSIDDYIDQNLMDSLIAAELECMFINTKYYYGVYSGYNKRFILGKFKNHEKVLLDSQFQFSLASIYKPGKYFLSIYFPRQTYELLHRMKLWVFLTVLFLIILILSFTFVIVTLLHQKKLSEIKTDFINNMTHEFKTPISTSSLAAEMIQRKEIISNPSKIKKYASIILYENNRLQNQVEQVLQVAILESGNQQFKIRRTNVHELLKAVINSFELRAKEGNINLSLNLSASNPLIMADKVHLLNIFYNLIDNAIKYTPDNPIINVSTSNSKNNIVISVADNGIGISKENQQNIFKNLFRVPIGNVQEVRGFGLGLYYVKTIIDQFGGKIKLTSEIGKGSNFELTFQSYVIKA